LKNYSNCRELMTFNSSRRVSDLCLWCSETSIPS